MRCSIFIAAALPLVQGVRIIQSNDDGWAEINLRTMFNVLTAAGHEAVLSGPAENQSGKGMQSIRKMPNQITYISRFIRCHTQDC
jgi:broad specificity polyphosphatase/5'/3'-nucleotidase SurE